jgi:hypothetical protein
MKRFLWLGFVLTLFGICTGCGDTFRPIIIPNPPTFPNPAAAHTVVAISDNGTTVAGSAMVIDVSGDSISSVADCTTPLCIGVAPVHAVQQTANQVLVVNHSDSISQSDSISKVSFSNIINISTTTTIGLPPGSAPNFVAVAPNQATAYVTLPNYVDPATGLVVPSVGVVSTTSNNVSATIPLSSSANPVALAVTPDNSKLYVANEGDSSISGFNTLDRSQRVGSPTTTGSFPPVWLTPRTDSQAVYVLEADGHLAWLDTTSTAGPDTLTLTTNPAISVPGATTMVYDSNLNRLYIPGGSVMAIVDVSQSPPQLLATIPIPPFTLLNIQQQVAATAVAAAALPDGSRAYVGSYAVLPSQFNISSVLGDGTTGTYAYTLTAGHDLTPGVTVTVTGTDTQQVSGFDGTYIVSAIVSGTTACPGTCFQTSNPTNTNGITDPVSGSGTGSNIFAQVTVVNATSNTVKTTAAIPGFPDATNQNYANGLYYVPVCVNNRFRFMMAAAGDSSRAYLSSCDGGNVNIIDTSNDTFIENLTAPASSRLNNPPQNPVFLFAGP